MTTVREECALSPDALRWRCDESRFPFATTAELDGDFTLIGQDRASDAIDLCLSIKSPGYNVYVAGVSGSGRLTAIRQLFEQMDLEQPSLTDKCYVHNFTESDRPTLLRLPPGDGCALRADMDKLVRTLRTHLGDIFEGDEYQARRKAIAQDGTERAAALFKDFEADLKKHNFQLVRLQMGPLVRPDVVPIIDGEPVIFEQLEAQVQAGERTDVDLDTIRVAHDQYHERLDEIVKQATSIEREAEQQLADLEQDYVKWAVGPMIATLKDRFPHPDVREYLNAVRDNIVTELDRFRRNKDEKPEGMPFASADDFVEYQVNVIVDNAKMTQVPVIVETAPAYQNLFGSIEAAAGQFGRMSTNHMKIHAGSLVRADGGFLVFNLADAITEYGVWKTLKRTLLSGQLDVRNESINSGVSIFGMKPQAIPLNVKVCVTGSRELYHLLYGWDDDFHRVFKIKADFDYEMQNTDDRATEMAGFIARLTRQQGLLPWNASGVAAFMEEAARRSGRQRKLTARFGGLADLVREADYFARKAGADAVTRAHVQTAIDKKIERTNLYEEKIRDGIEDGQVLIDTQGGVEGQVNGLAVYSVGDYQFGKPARITAKAGVGQAGIINIEREAKLSGATHDKGMLILQGYLRATYGSDKPLTLSASLCFEQSYGGVDGDSASSTELYALLSSLAGLPLDQGIAVTGSISQHGEVQAIGGVNEKIEGFFDLCQSRGLNGTQGVIIPKSNVGDLMLHESVVQAVADGQFHIWAIAHVDQGMELLMGAAAGVRDAEGAFPEDSVHGRAERRLVDVSEILKAHEHHDVDGDSEDEDEDESAPEPEPDPTEDDTRDDDVPPEDETAEDDDAE